MSSHISMFFDPRVMRNYRPEYVSARRIPEAAAIEPSLRGARRGGPDVGHHADGKRAAAVPENR